MYIYRQLGINIVVTYHILRYNWFAVLVSPLILGDVLLEEIFLSPCGT